MHRAPLLVLLLAAASVACGQEEAPAEPVIRTVRYMAVSAAGAEQTRTFSGVARAGVESSLSFRVAGVVDRVAVVVGSRVTRGALIAQLDPIDYELRVKQAEAALSQARAQASNAGADLQRVRLLFENDNASRNDLDAATAGEVSARAQVDSAAQQLDLARRQVGYTRLTAPIAGAIAEVRVEENENVAPGQAIVVLAAGQQPEVELTVPEGLITGIADGDAVRVRFDALAGREFDGSVTEVGVVASALATTFPVIVRLQDAADVRPGMAADVTFTFRVGDGSPRFILPPAAVAEDRTGRFVFVAERAGGDLATARRRAVTVGSFTSGGLEILDGLSEGDLVITAGVSRIEDGREVRLDGAQG